MRATAAGPRLALQFLVYPATDMRMDWPSAERHAQQLPLTRAAMDWFIAHYLRSKADEADWRASPLRASSLKGLPPALIMTAGFDPLCDEGEAYAKALRAAGVAVVHERFAGQIHGFLTMGRIVADTGRAIALAAAALRQSFAAGLSAAVILGVGASEQRFGHNRVPRADGTLTFVCPIRVPLCASPARHRQTKPGAFPDLCGRKQVPFLLSVDAAGIRDWLQSPGMR